ncbi:MAG: vWA domain-containing protein [Acidimicrobiales bacterium]
MFIGVDRAIFGSSFAERLNRAGVAVPLGAVNRLVHSMEAAGPISKRELYWISRISLLDSSADIPVFNAVFAAVFDLSLEEMKNPESRRAVPAPRREDDAYLPLRVPDAEGQAGEGLPWATLPSVTDSNDDDRDASEDAAIPERLPSLLEAEMDTPFDLLDPEVLAEVEAALERAFPRWPTRPSRRRQPWAKGPTIELRRSLRSALRTGGEPLFLKRSRQHVRPRRVVMLVDVSGSMQSFTRPYLHLTRSLAVSGRAEIFAFGTKLTRITSSLRHRSADEAVDRASEEVGDRFGGTRLAHSIHSLLTDGVWGSYTRGAIVIIASDGWDTDPPDEVEKQMAKLARRCHRVIWLNPRSADPEFEPLVGSMAAALPYCSDFLPGHSLRSMSDVVDAICA